MVNYQDPTDNPHIDMTIPVKSRLDLATWENLDFSAQFVMGQLKSDRVAWKPHIKDNVLDKRTQGRYASRTLI